MKLYTIKKECELLLSSWRDSLKIFYPKNLKLFGLVTLNAVAQAVKPMIKVLWWFYIPWIAIQGAMFFGWPWKSSLLSGNTGSYILMSVYALFLSLLFHSALFLLYLSVRPSVKIKNTVYYFDYCFYFVVYLGALFVCGMLLSGLLMIPVVASIVHIIFYLLFLVPSEFQNSYLFISPLFIFILFFYLDSDGRLRSFFQSVCRGTKMLIYNYPFCLISMICWHLVLMGIGWLHGFALTYLSSFSTQLIVIGSYNLLFLVILFILTCYFGNFYTKKVHDQFNLYLD